jgi:hypothetical protein
MIMLRYKLGPLAGNCFNKKLPVARPTYLRKER